MEYFKVKTRYHGNFGSKHNAPDEQLSGVRYMLLPATVFGLPITKEAARKLWEAEGYDSGSYRCYHSHDCCACDYWDSMYLVVSGSRAIARQGFGVNI